MAKLVNLTCNSFIKLTPVCKSCENYDEIQPPRDNHTHLCKRDSFYHLKHSKEFFGGVLKLKAMLNMIERGTYKALISYKGLKIRKPVFQSWKKSGKYR